jgi:TetR/AcrR family transcriptional repressor of nem operon
MSAKAEQKTRTHEAILASACRLLRENGIGGARVADVMAGAGLTVGGFYAHFASKQELVDAAMRRTAAFMRGKLFARIDDKPADARGTVVLKRYLSAAHRDDPANGCPLPAVIGEISTSSPEHRPVLAEEVDRLVTELAAQLPAEAGRSRRATALGMVALMYGGLTLSRALRGTELSDEILRACRAFGSRERGAQPIPGAHGEREGPEVRPGTHVQREVEGR